MILNQGWHKTVKMVASPLRFFAVAILALTSVIIMFGVRSSLPSDVTLLIILVSFFVLIFIIGLVSYLIIRHPKKLVFDQEAHLTVLREGLGDSEFSKLYIPGTIKNVEPLRSIESEKK